MPRRDPPAAARPVLCFLPHLSPSSLLLWHLPAFGPVLASCWHCAVVPRVPLARRPRSIPQPSPAPLWPLTPRHLFALVTLCLAGRCPDRPPPPLPPLPLCALPGQPRERDVIRNLRLVSGSACRSPHGQAPAAATGDSRHPDAVPWWGGGSGSGAEAGCQPGWVSPGQALPAASR